MAYFVFKATVCTLEVLKYFVTYRISLPSTLSLFVMSGVFWIMYSLSQEQCIYCITLKVYLTFLIGSVIHVLSWDMTLSTILWLSWWFGGQGLIFSWQLWELNNRHFSPLDAFSSGFFITLSEGHDQTSPEAQSRSTLMGWFHSKEHSLYLLFSTFTLTYCVFHGLFIKCTGLPLFCYYSFLDKSSSMFSVVSNR